MTATMVQVLQTLALVLCVARSSWAVPTKADMAMMAMDTGENLHTVEAPENIHRALIQQDAGSSASTEGDSDVYQDMGMSQEEMWDCGWYGNDVPRAAVSLKACKDYLDTRLLNCVPWTKKYGDENPKAVRHITLDEVHIKCKHTKDALDQLTTVPGDTSTCIWCMQNINTN